MGADSPRSKNIFLRTPRAIRIMSQIGGWAPPRGQTWKVGVGPKFLNPNFSKMVPWIFPKIFVWKGHMNPRRCANFRENLIRKKISGRNFRKFRWGGPDPQTTRNIPTRAWQVGGGHWPSYHGTCDLVPGPAVLEKYGVEKKPLAPPSGKTGNSSVTWLGMLMKVDGVYIVLKFGDIPTNRYGAMGHRSFGRIALQRKIHWSECIPIITALTRDGVDN